MARKRHTAEEIVAKLRQVDVLMAQGRQVPDARRDGSHVLSMAKRVWWPEGRSGEASQRTGDGERSSPASGVGSDAGQADPGRGRKGKLLSPSRRPPCVRRSCDDRDSHIRETGVPGIRSASIDAAQDPNGTRMNGGVTVWHSARR